MNRNYFNSDAPLTYSSDEAVGPGMDCLQLRQSPGPFHYLINEQVKSLVALQELQHEVGALLEFRDLVIETFPNLRTKLASSTPTTMNNSNNTQHHNSNNNNNNSNSNSINHNQHHPHHHNHNNHIIMSNIPVRNNGGNCTGGNSDWTPGVRVRKKITNSCNKDDSRINNKKSGDTTTIQDSGFSTETSSKETHSASSTVPSSSQSTTPGTQIDETEDELWNLLDIIHRKGTRLKDEVEALQGTLQDNVVNDESDFQRVLFRASTDDVRKLQKERDFLLDRLAEMEAEVLAGRIHTSRLQEDLENLLTTKHDLEEQLKAIVTQRGEVNSRIHDLHLQFVTKNCSSISETKIINCNNKNELTTSQQQQQEIEQQQLQRINNKTFNNNSISINNKSELDLVFYCDRIPKVKVPDSKKIAAILKEQNPLILQKHLLTTTVQNQVLHQQLDTAARLEIGLADKLDKAREENDELRFQLEDKNIELEGTRARVRMLEQLQKSINNISNNSSPDIIPTTNATITTTTLTSSINDLVLSRTEILTPSMKAMSPLPMNLQMDHSSSTESAHDQAENHNSNYENLTNNNKKNFIEKRNIKPSKIPLKSYTAPKPPNLSSSSSSSSTTTTTGGAGGGGGTGCFGGKQSPAPGARSRSGESPGRPHSAQSWRNRSEGNSLSGNKSNTSLTKSRNGSLVTSKDSLSSKLRNITTTNSINGDSIIINNNIKNNTNFATINRAGTLRKNNSPLKWSNNNFNNGTLTTTTMGKDGLSTSTTSSPTTNVDKVRPKTTSSFWNFFRLHNVQT